MIFGERQLFAVECELTSRVGRWIYGRFRVWVAANPIGAYTDEVIDLKGTTGVLRQPIPRASPAMAALGPDEFLELVWSACYGDGQYNDTECRALRQHVWFDSCEGFENVRSVIAKVETNYRIVWRISGETSAREQIVPATVYDSVASYLPLSTASTSIETTNDILVSIGVSVTSLRPIGSIE